MGENIKLIFFSYFWNKETKFYHKMRWYFKMCNILKKIKANLVNLKLILIISVIQYSIELAKIYILFFMNGKILNSFEFFIEKHYTLKKMLYIFRTRNFNENFKVI